MRGARAHRVHPGPERLVPRARPAPRRPIRGSGRTALVRGRDGGEAFPGGTPRGREASEPSRPPEGARSPASRRARRRRTRPRRLTAVPLPSPLAAAVSHPADGLTMQPCSVGGRKGRCSTSRVHVNRATGSGPTIPIRVGVVPAIGSHRQPSSGSRAQRVTSSSSTSAVREPRTSPARPYPVSQAPRCCEPRSPS